MKPHALILATVCILSFVGCGREQSSPPNVKTYTEQEVTDFFAVGRSRDEIIARFGQPFLSITNRPGNVQIYYNLPLPHPLVLQNFAFSGFQVRFTNGVFASWGASHRDIQ